MLMARDDGSIIVGLGTPEKSIVVADDDGKDKRKMKKKVCRNLAKGGGGGRQGHREAPRAAGWTEGWPATRCAAEAVATGGTVHPPTFAENALF